MALSNCGLALIVLIIGAVCFLPGAIAASVPAGEVYRRGRGEGVSLMVNVYEGEEVVAGMLDLFRERGVFVTFFVGGCWADDHVPLVRRMTAEGHEVGSHGYFHRDHEALSLKENLEEISASVEFLSLVTGQEISLFAPPSGAYGSDTLRAAESLGLKTILWSKDTIDWRDKDYELVYKRATSDIQSGDLVLMHPTAHTLKALPTILDYYAANGLSTATVSEILTEEGSY